MPITAASSAPRPRSQPGPGAVDADRRRPDPVPGQQVQGEQRRHHAEADADQLVDEVEPRPGWAPPSCSAWPGSARAGSARAACAAVRAPRTRPRRRARPRGPAAPRCAAPAGPACWPAAAQGRSRAAAAGAATATAERRGRIRPGRPQATGGRDGAGSVRVTGTSEAGAAVCPLYGSNERARVAPPRADPGPAKPTAPTHSRSRMRLGRGGPSACAPRTSPQGPRKQWRRRRISPRSVDRVGAGDPNRRRRPALGMVASHETGRQLEATLLARMED